MKVPSDLVSEIRADADLLSVPKWIPPKEWAEKYRILPKGSAESGHFRFSRCPWIVPILERCTSTNHNKVVMVCGAQLSKTDGLLLNMAGWKLSVDPTPVIFYTATSNLARSASKYRFRPMIEAAETLHSAPPSTSGNTIHEMEVNGQRLGICSSGTVSQLRMQNAGLVLIDERDGQTQVTSEGDVVDVASARLATYANKMMVITTTPLRGRVTSKIDVFSGIERWEIAPDDEVFSPGWRLWQQGTRHEWAIPCPHCNKHFTPRSRLLVWGNSQDPTVAAQNARVQCPSCEKLIENKSLPAMNAKGLMVAPGQRVVDGVLFGEEPANLIYSCWVSGLCSHWVTWSERAYALAKARLEERVTPGSLQGVLNVDFGELYSEDREELKDDVVRRCIADYLMGEVDPRVTMLTMGVDVSGDRFIYVVRGWAHDGTSWLIHCGDIWGDTDSPQTWRELGDFIDDADFEGLKIRRVAVDAGYRPNNTYAFARLHRGVVHPVMGSTSQRRIYATRPVDVDVNGKIIRGGCKLGSFQPDWAKDYVHSHIMYDASEPGAFFVPKDVPDKYFREITAEMKVEKSDGTFAFKMLRRSNHLLDAEGMAWVMAQTTRIPRSRRAHRPDDDEQRKGISSGERAATTVQPGSDWGSGIGSNW